MSKEIKKVLVIKLGALGDFVLALAAMKKNHGQKSVCFLSDHNIIIGIQKNNALNFGHSTTQENQRVKVSVFFLCLIGQS